MSHERSRKGKFWILAITLLNVKRREMYFLDSLNNFYESDNFEHNNFFFLHWFICKTFLNQINSFKLLQIKLRTEFFLPMSMFNFENVKWIFLIWSHFNWQHKQLMQCFNWKQFLLALTWKLKISENRPLESIQIMSMLLYYDYYCDFWGFKNFWEFNLLLP